jgi:hypothetical protein
MLRDELKHITINSMLEDNKISVRTSNCCFNAQFNSLFDIIDYYEKGESFSNIRNAGRRTCLELETLCKEYILKLEKPVRIIDETPEEQKQKREDYIKSLIENDFLNAIETKQVDANDILNYLSISQKVILEDKFKRYSTVYSIRTTNRIRAVGFNNFVTNYLFCSDNELYKIHGLGNKSIEEAIDLKGKMKEEFLQSINLQEEDIAKINLIREKGDIMLNDFVAEFYRNNNHLPMFWILEQQLITSKNRSIDILINTFKIFQNYQFKTLDEIASIYDITRERVRQIRNGTFHGTFEITNELDGFKKTDEFVQIRQFLQRKEDWFYIVGLIQETHFVSQVSYYIQSFLTKEQCSFSVEFALKILAYIFRDKFALYGGFDLNNRDKSWKSTYLIRNEFADIFDFEKVKEEFSNKLVDSTTDYLLDIDNYIANSQCWKQFNFDKTDDITSIVKDILLHEFGLYSEDIDSNSIKIPANKELNPLDVVFEILKIKGEPMHLDDIFVEFKIIMPEHRYTQENNADRLRPFLQRHDEITFRKRNSIYLLKEWEHIRSGTIRDVIIEFLLANDLPQTVETIAEYVLQHFPETNQKNIHSTMFYYRSGSVKQELTGAALNEFLLKRAGHTWDDVIEEDATFNDIDEATIKKYLRKAEETGRLPDIDGLTTLELLDKLRLTKNGKLKRAAIVLFGKDPGRFYPNTFVKIGKFEDDDFTIRFQELEDGNIIQVLDKVLRTLDYKFLIRNISFEGMNRIETLEYPIPALRETLLNAMLCKPLHNTHYVNQYIM